MAALRQGRVLGLLLAVAAIAAACGSTPEQVTSVQRDSSPLPQTLLTGTAGDVADGALTSTVGDVVDPGPVGDTSHAEWLRLPDAPLSPRIGATTIAFGDEVLVIGGTNETCAGDCVEPTTAFADGAALNLESLTWRTLPDAPVDFLWSSAVAVDDAIYLSARCPGSGGDCSGDSEMLRLRVADNQWDRLPSPSDRGSLLTAVGGRLVASAGGGDGGSGWADYAFDPTNDTWTLLPPDPLPRNEDRFVVDLNGDIGVFATQRSTDKKAGVAFNFDTGEWRELAAPNSYGYQLWMVDGLGYLAPHLKGEPGGIYDSVSDTWSPLPNPPADNSWDPDISGVVGADTAAFGEYEFGWVIDAVAGEWLEIPPRPGSAQSTSGSMTNWGPNMFVFGAERWTGDEDDGDQSVELLNEAWLWTRSGNYGPDQDVPVSVGDPYDIVQRGTEIELECPAGVETRDTSWPGSGQDTKPRAVREGFADSVQDPNNAPTEFETGDGWSTWVRHDDEGNVVSYVTIVQLGKAWDLSYGSYCHIVAPGPPPAPLTLSVSNQSFDDPSVFLTVLLDGEVVVDQKFDVEGQHNWFTFELELAPGEHTLTVTSNTGVETTQEFTTEPGQPRWAALDYWFEPEEGGRFFSFHIQDTAIYFA